MKLQRLDKLIATQAGLTRSEAAAAIRQGRVRVGDALCRDAARKLDPQAETVSLDGRALTFHEHICLMLNKPAGLLCVSRDPRVPTVTDLVPAEWRHRGLSPAGRLDKDSTGLVLLTDDGDLCHRIITPHHEVYKRYRVRVDAPVTPAIIEAFASGITLSDGTVCRPAGLRLLEDGPEPLTEVAICEGRYHQIKRMFGTCGCGVLFLERTAIGSLRLDPALAEGACRLMTEAEIASVFFRDAEYMAKYYHYLTN